MASPAVWLPISYYIHDYEYVEDGCDEALRRAVHDGIVYASSGCHHEPPFQDITVAMVAAAERQARKDGRPVRAFRPPKEEIRSPIPKRNLFTERRLEVIGLIAAGFTQEEIAITLGITRRTAKMHTDVLRSLLHVERGREIPLAFYKLTGRDPFSLAPKVAPPVVPEELPQTKEGKSLMEVVSEMFDPERSTYE